MTTIVYAKIATTLFKKNGKDVESELARGQELKVLNDNHAFWLLVEVARSTLTGLVKKADVSDSMPVMDDEEFAFPDEPTSKKKVDLTWLNDRIAWFKLNSKKIGRWSLRIAILLVVLFVASRIDWLTLLRQTGEYSKLGVGIWLGYGNLMTLVVAGGLVALLYSAYVAQSFEDEKFAKATIAWTFAMEAVALFWAVGALIAGAPTSMVVRYLALLCLVPVPLALVSRDLYDIEFSIGSYVVCTVVVVLAIVYSAMDAFLGTGEWITPVYFSMPLVVLIPSWILPALYKAIRKG